MVNPKAVIEEILATGLKVSLERERLAVIFQKSGIRLDAEMRIAEISGDPLIALKSLMRNLSDLAVVKISAKQVVRRAGLTL